MNAGAGADGGTGIAVGGPPLGHKEFGTLRRMIHDLTGIKLNDEKQSLVANRLQRRLRALGLDSFHDYIQHLNADATGAETRELINAITTNKTSFFREPHHFDFLMKRLVPELLARADATGEKRIRIWSSACSMGHEPWSIAIALQQSLGLRSDWDIRILASDLDTEVLRTAEEAIYSKDAIAEVPLSFRKDAFVQLDDDTYQVAPELHRLVTFRQINLIERPWPIHAKFDAVFCRNVAIYFDRATQRPLFESLAATLRPTGYLFSGHSENLHWLNDLLTPVGNTVHKLKNPEAESGTRVVATPIARPAREVAIQAGEVHASKEPTIIRTLLGSCVSVCLFDPDRKIGGMNHFMLPHGDVRGGSAAYYGIHAMEILINQMMKLGAERRRLVAKVFGASELRVASSIAARNGEFALSYLQEEKIPIVAKKLGVLQPLSVLFDTSTGTARVREVERSKEAEDDGVTLVPKAAKPTIDVQPDVVFFGVRR